MERVDCIDEEEMDLNGIFILYDGPIQILSIYSMKEHFASPWENEEVKYHVWPVSSYYYYF